MQDKLEENKSLKFEDESNNIVGPSSGHSEESSPALLHLALLQAQDSKAESNPFSFTAFLRQQHRAKEEAMANPLIYEEPKSSLIISELPDVPEDFFHRPATEEELSSMQLLQPLFSSDCQSLQNFHCKSNFEDKFSKDHVLGQLKEENLQLHRLLQNNSKSIRLAHENYLLKTKLRNLSLLLNDKIQRIGHLEKELQNQSRRDKEETQTLEHMVQQVEHNLKMSTERAIRAESTVHRLKQELKDMEKQINYLQKENAELRLSSNMADITNKAKELSAKLNNAADTAEAPTRTLVEGIGHLRLLASLVGDLTKVTER